MRSTATKRPANRATASRNVTVAASRSISLSAVEKVLGLTVAVARDRLSRLTEREKQVAAKMAKGKQNARIAEELGISPKTLDIHRANTMHKLEVATAARVANLVNLVCLAEIAGAS
jgi:two-component system, LuxR family, response regulator FixJ